MAGKLQNSPGGCKDIHQECQGDLSTKSWYHQFIRSSLIFPPVIRGLFSLEKSCHGDSGMWSLPDTWLESCKLPRVSGRRFIKNVEENSSTKEVIPSMHRASLIHKRRFLFTRNWFHGEGRDPYQKPMAGKLQNTPGGWKEFPKDHSGTWRPLCTMESKLS